MNLDPIIIYKKHKSLFITALEWLAILIPLILLLILMMRSIAPWGKSLVYHFYMNTQNESYGKLKDAQLVETYTINGNEAKKMQNIVLTKDTTNFSIMPGDSALSQVVFHITIPGGTSQLPSLVVNVTNPQTGAADDFIVKNDIVEKYGDKSFAFNGYSVISFDPTLMSAENVSKTLDSYQNNNEKLEICYLDKKFQYYNVDLITKSTDAVPTTSIILRGEHTFYVFVSDDGILDLSFIKNDLNWYDGLDGVNAIISRDGDYVDSVSIPDDGIFTGQQGRDIGKDQPLNIYFKNLKKGVYEVRLTGGQDYTLRNFRTTNTKVVIADNIFLANNKIYGNEGGNTTIYTMAPRLFTSFYHDTFKNDILLNNSIRPYTNAQQYRTMELDKNQINKIDFTDPDVALSSRDFYSFTKESYFRPSVVEQINCQSFTEDVAKSTKLLVYRPTNVKKEGDKYTLTIPFSSKQLNSDGMYSFSLSIPGLTQSQRPITVSEFSVEFVR